MDYASYVPPEPYTSVYRDLHNVDILTFDIGIALSWSSLL